MMIAGQYNLEIQNVQLSDDGIYQCWLGQTESQPLHMSRPATLTVLGTVRFEISFEIGLKIGLKFSSSRCSPTDQLRRYVLRCGESGIHDSVRDQRRETPGKHQLGCRQSK